MTDIQRQGRSQPALPLPALVVGLSIHGLAVARAIARHHVPVYCLADIEVPPQPTVYTRYASVYFRRGLNTGPLPRFLMEVAQEIGTPQKIVLFPTSDRIAKAIAHAWTELSDRFLLSWSHCRNLVGELQRKDSLATYCEAAGVLHPRSIVLHSASDCTSIANRLRFPLAIKPVQPLSSFKAIRVSNLQELQRYTAEFAADLPFVTQEWIDGPEPSLYSCTTYLDRGRPLYLFTSRKIAASPPSIGQGTVFETIDEPLVKDITSRFVRNLDLTGPVAVEFKRDTAGQFWLIEPNVGRTEYCVDLAIQSGFNLPLVEYLHVTGQSVESQIPTRIKESAWFDTDKDPRCFLANLRAMRTPTGLWRSAIFPFVGHDDWRPLATSLNRQISDSLGAMARRLSGTTRHSDN